MNEYILYGYIRSQSLREMTENYIRCHGGNVLFYVDDTQIPGVYPVEEIANFPKATIVIMCTSAGAVIEKITALNLPNLVVVAPLLGYRFICDAYEPPRDMQKKTSSWIAIHENVLRKLYCLDDEYTNNLLDKLISERQSFRWISADWAVKYGAPEEYFVNRMFTGGGQMTLVDGGTWQGDTIKHLYSTYRDKLAYIYAFEPDNANYIIAKEEITNLGLAERTECFNMGIYNKRATLRFSGNNDMIEQDENGDIIVPVCCVDDVINTVIGDLYIKMDLEGCEVKALEGAKNTIQKYRPYMAICVYHRMKDILEVPQYISSIMSGYKFYLRAGFHTECYAIPQ